MKDMFKRIISAQCEQARDYLKISLALLEVNPGATHLLGYEQGVIASKRGRILELGICVDVGDKVKLRTTQKCYLDAPVWFKEMPLFRHRNHHCLIEESPEVDCEKAFSIFKIGDKYVGQRPHWDYNITAPKTFKPKSIESEDLLERMEMESIGTIYGSTMDLTISHILMSTKRATITTKWSNGLAKNYFDESKLKKNDDSDADIWPNMFDAIKDIAGIIAKWASLIWTGLVIFFVVYFLGSWIISVIVSAVKKGVRHEDTAITFYSLFYGLYWLFFNIPKLFYMFPEMKRKLEQLEVKKQENSNGDDKSKEPVQVNIAQYYMDNPNSRMAH